MHIAIAIVVCVCVCVVLVIMIYMAVCACDGRVMFFIFCFHSLIIFGNRLCQPWAV